MSPVRPVSIVVTLSALLAWTCARAATRLDDVPRLAYASKPAVVRVNAYAKAQFHLPGAALSAVAASLGTQPRGADGTEVVVETGAGGSGSGFIIRSDGYILTSGHVVAATRDPSDLTRALRRNGAIAALVKFFPIELLRSRQRVAGLEREIELLAGSGQVEKTQLVDQVELSDGETFEFAIVRYSPSLGDGGADLALLKIKRHNLPALPLGESSSVRVGDPIWTIGYPAVASSTDEVIGGWLSSDSDLEATFNGGTITAIRRDVANREVLQSNAAVYQGNSGGPAIDRDGAVIGIATWGHAGAESIKFLVPIDIARSFLAEARVTPVVDGSFNVAYAAALDAARTGHWADARGELETASRLFPNSPDLGRFRSDLERAMRDSPWWEKWSVTASLAGVLLVGVIATILIMVMRNSIDRRMSVVPASDVAATGSEITVFPSARASDEVAPAETSGQMLGRFTILNGVRAGERLALGGTGIRIGRERAICEIVLDNPKISRLHAEVVSMDGKVLLIDRNSSNGTFVNDQKIDRRFLRDGDIIYFGGRNAIAVAYHG